MFKNLIEFILYYRDKIFHRANLDNGFQYEEPQKPDWKFGEFGFTKRELNKSKNWKSYRSRGEEQKRPDSSETMACTVYSSLNAIEQLMNRMKAMVENEEADEEIQEMVKIFKYFEFYDENGEANLSDPFTAKVSGTTYRGNTFNNVAQSFRHAGIVAEKVYPTPEKYTWSDYYRTIPQEVLNKGLEFTEYIEINHEWVYPEQINDTKVYSPNTTSVYAGNGWNTEAVQKPSGNYHNHAVDNDYYEDKKFDGIFDSYKPFDKKVSWNYGLGVGKIFGFTLKKNLPNLRVILLKEGRQYVMRSEVNAGGHGEIYEIKTDKLIYISPQDWNNMGVKEKTIQQKIKFVTEDYYKKLI